MPVKEADEKFYKNEVEEKKSLLPEEVKKICECELSSYLSSFLH